MATTYSGACFCGAVQFEVTGEPMLQGFCHCNDCRGWSGGPVTSYALWQSGDVRFTAGGDKAVSYSKSGQAERSHCSECGGALMTAIPAAGMTDVYPHLLKGFSFQPQAHVHYGVRVVEMNDGLPKFKDMPAEAGGSGEMAGRFFTPHSSSRESQSRRKCIMRTTAIQSASIR